MMAGKQHSYAVGLQWLGNDGEGTSSYRSYRRAHVLRAEGKPPIPGSSDPTFRGDRDRWNPEELLVASLSACHQLWYLHLCAEAGVVVMEYTDDAAGTMVEEANGAGQFSEVVLRPRVTIAPGSDWQVAQGLHREAHARCFIARSVNFEVRHEATVRRGGDQVGGNQAGGK